MPQVTNKILTDCPVNVPNSSWRHLECFRSFRSKLVTHQDPNLLQRDSKISPGRKDGERKVYSGILSYVLDTMRNCLPVHSLPLHLDIGLHAMKLPLQGSPLSCKWSSLLLVILPQSLEQEGGAQVFQRSSSQEWFPEPKTSVPLSFPGWGKWKEFAAFAA